MLPDAGQPAQQASAPIGVCHWVHAQPEVQTEQMHTSSAGVERMKSANPHTERTATPVTQGAPHSRPDHQLPSSRPAAGSPRPSAAVLEAEMAAGGCGPCVIITGMSTPRPGTVQVPHFPPAQGLGVCACPVLVGFLLGGSTGHQESTKLCGSAPPHFCPRHLRARTVARMRLRLGGHPCDQGTGPQQQTKLCGMGGAPLLLPQAPQGWSWGQAEAGRPLE